MTGRMGMEFDDVSSTQEIQSGLWFFPKRWRVNWKIYVKFLTYTNFCEKYILQSSSFCRVIKSICSKVAGFLVTYIAVVWNKSKAGWVHSSFLNNDIFDSTTDTQTHVDTSHLVIFCKFRKYPFYNGSDSLQVSYDVFFFS